MELLISVLAAVIAHEGGHFVASLCFGHRLTFRFAWGVLWKVPVPRWVWTMPEMEKWKQEVVALAGFIAELALGGVCILFSWWMVAVVAVLHLAGYPFYAGEDSDFKFLS